MFKSELVDLTCWLPKQQPDTIRIGIPVCHLSTSGAAAAEHIQLESPGTNFVDVLRLNQEITRTPENDTTELSGRNESASTPISCH